jgi:hypothetical protein
MGGSVSPAKASFTILRPPLQYIGPWFHLVRALANVVGLAAFALICRGTPMKWPQFA